MADKTTKSPNKLKGRNKNEILIVGFVNSFITYFIFYFPKSISKRIGMHDAVTASVQTPCSPPSQLRLCVV